MKRNILLRLLLPVIITVTALVAVKAQSPTYELYVTNQQLVSSNTYQFDVYLLRTGSTPLEMASMQFGLGIDTAVANGGTLSFSYISGSSQLNSAQLPQSFQLGTTSQLQLINGVNYRFMNQAARVGPGAGLGTTISAVKTACTSPGTRIGTYRLVNTTDFKTGSSFKHVFSTSAGSGRTNTVIAAYVGGVNTTITGTNMGYQTTGTCDLNPTLNGGCSLTAQISTSPVTCFGGSNGAASITLSGTTSTSSGTYILDGGTPNAFTSNPFSIASLTAGTHTVIATSSNCNTPLTTFNITAPTGPINTQLSASACNTYTLPWATVVTTSGSYSRVYTAVNGCDSTVTFNVTIRNRTFRDTTAAACNSFTWYGTNYTVSGVYTYLLPVQNAQQCDSLVRLQLTINSAPAALQTTGTAICGSGSATVTAILPNGIGCRWYAASTGGSILSTAASYVSTISATTTYYAEAIGISTGCVSSTRTATVATVNTLPGAVTTVLGATRCASDTATITATAATGNTINWYADSTTSTVLQAGTASGVNSYFTSVVSVTTTYWVASKSLTNGCLSAARKSVVLTINARPEPPLTVDGSRCDTGKVVLTATAPPGATLAWYATPTGGTSLSTAAIYTTPSILTAPSETDYYVESRSTANGCVSAVRATCTATINGLPATPVTTGGSRCGTGIVRVSATSATSGAAIDWYSAASAGTLIRSNTAILDTLLTSSKTFYALSRVEATGCISKTRTAATATINAIPANVTTVLGASRCGADTATLTATAGTGNTINWYADSTTSTVLQAGTATGVNSYRTPVVSATTTYWVASRSLTTGCLSSARRSVVLTISSRPAAPGAVNGTRCDTGKVVLTATAPTGATLAWYTTPTGGTSLSTSASYTTPSILTSPSVTNYYVESRITATGCASNTRTLCTATVNSLPANPVTTGGSNCGTGIVRVSATSATSGAVIDWYSAATAGTLIRSNTANLDSLLTSSKTFYALSRITSTGCISKTRTAATATINAIPANVTTVLGASRCGADTATLTATAVTGNTINWYADSTTSTVLQAGTATGVNSYRTPVVSATTTYWVASRSLTTGCLSAARRSVVLTISSRPAAPGAVNGTRCDTGKVVLTATAPTGATLAWYTTPTGGTSLSTSASYTTPSILTSPSVTNYYVESRTSNGCVSASRTLCTATVNSIPANPVTTGGARCGTGIVRVSATSATSGAAIDWYSAATAGTLIRSNTANLDTLLTSSKTFYALSRVATTGCISKIRVAAVATINAIPSAPSSISGTTSICPIVGTATAATYTCSAVTGAVSYVWSIPPTAVIDSGSNGIRIKVRFLAASANDSIVAQAVSAVGCTGAKKVLKLITTGCAITGKWWSQQNTPEEPTALLVYPNPAPNEFHIQSNLPEAVKVHVSIFDASGRRVNNYHTQLKGGDTFGHDLLPGFYYLHIKGNNIDFRTKILKY